MAVDFPTPVSVGEEFVAAGITYIWTGQGWGIKPYIPPPPEDVSEFPSGTIMLFCQASAPVGWVQVTTQNDKALRVVSGVGGQAGGTNPFSTVMAQTVVSNTTPTINSMTYHNHQGGNTGNSPALWDQNTSTTTGGTGPYGVVTNQAHYHGIPTDGGSWPHDHSFMMAMQYVDIILAAKA